MGIKIGSLTIDRNELSGAFGDIGTDLPLLIGMLLATDLETANAFVVFGVFQIITAFVYRIPMPVQPLKAVALIVITQKLTVDVIWGGGLAIGIIMLFLTVSGILVWLNRKIPKTVIRGIQLGLGLQLCNLAMKEYVPSDGSIGYIFAIAGFITGLILVGNKKYPPAIFILALGLIFVILFRFDQIPIPRFEIPQFKVPDISMESIFTGLLILALPQIPLSLGNSVFATHQLVKDYFPEKKVGINKIGYSYSVMNIIIPLLGGVPVCHGSGGIAGHHTFGGRTGGSTFIYGLFYIILGLVFSSGSANTLLVYPKSILGVILLFEGFALIILLKDIITNKKMFLIAILVAIIATNVKNGYLYGMIVGIAVYYLTDHLFLKHFGNKEL